VNDCRKISAIPAQRRCSGGEATVFKKKYSQMKLQMKREALAKLNLQAIETIKQVFGISRRFGRGGAI
jgi:hypothetical protein